MKLQRLFSVFPGGWPGVGLLLLRASVGAIATAQGWADLAGVSDSTGVVLSIGLLLAVGGISMLAGFLTPIGGALVELGILVTWVSRVPAPAPDLFAERLLSFLVAMAALSIMFIGPGALSIDSRLFGRREITIPRIHRRPEDQA